MIEAEERMKFEEWLVNTDRTYLRQGTHYEWPHTSDLWNCWQARAALSAPAVPEGYKLLKDTTHDERSFPEDAPSENGNYWCKCHWCLRMFVGHKRRATCNGCVAAPSPQEQAPRASNPDEVICPACTHQFRAIPENVQAELRAFQAAAPTGAEPVAWFTEDHLNDRSATTYSREVATRWGVKGWPVTALYFASTTPRAPLTDTEIDELWEWAPDYVDDPGGTLKRRAFARAVIAADREPV